MAAAKHQGMWVVHRETDGFNMIRTGSAMQTHSTFSVHFLKIHRVTYIFIYSPRFLQYTPNIYQSLPRLNDIYIYQSYSDIPSHGLVKMCSRILILHSTFVSLNIKFCYSCSFDVFDRLLLL